MKTKLFSILTALFVFCSANLFAQTNNDAIAAGDLNDDGVVDVADLNALFKIIDNQGTTTEPVYYWYVGQTDPSTMTEISPIVTDKTSPGWRLIGTELPNYSSSNKLWDDSISDISLGSRNYWYVAIPNNSSAIVRDGLGNDGTTVDICTKQSNVTINGIEYKIFKSDQNYRSFQYPIY